MADDLNEKLKTFSDKHGAVLIGMHKELKGMQVSLNKVKVNLKKTEELHDTIKSSFDNQRYEFDNDRQALKDFVNTQLLDLRTQFESQKQISLQNFKNLDKKQQIIENLHEKCVSLLTEHKQRDIDFKKREFLVHKWMKRMEVCVLICVLIALFSLWFLIWRH